MKKEEDINLYIKGMSKIKIGDIIVSDDHAAIGSLEEINGRLLVMTDKGAIEYEPYVSDWEHYLQKKNNQIKNRI